MQKPLIAMARKKEKLSKLFKYHFVWNRKAKVFKILYKAWSIRFLSRLFKV